MTREDEVRLIAFRIWQEDGCCDGRDMEHWLMAEAIWEQEQKKEIEPVVTTEKKPAETVKAEKRSSRKKTHRN